MAAGTHLAAIVNLHNEGQSALPSLISAWRATQVAMDRGIDTEFLVVLDSADEPTREIAVEWESRGSRIVEVDVSDLGQARNAAALASSSDWLAFLDGDDLWSENWLAESYDRAASTDADDLVVFHPQCNVIFGDHHSVVHHIASHSSWFSWARARLHNPWTALSMVRRAVVASVPYPSNDLERGFGFEDWSWNLEVLRRGGRHEVIDDTCHFIRRTNGASLLSKSNTALRTPYPNSTGDDSSVPGQVSTVSTSLQRDHTLPPTFSSGPFISSAVLNQQIRRATAIEPAISRTLPATTTVLPQNHNTHITDEQVALEQIDVAIREGAHTITSAIEQSTKLTELPEALMMRVVAEVLLNQSLAEVPHGPHELITQCMSYFPQLREGAQGERFLS